MGRRVAPGLPRMVLLLLLLVLGVPTYGALSGEPLTPNPTCRRCCEPGELPVNDAAMSPSAVPYVVPEIRPYINITILKGEDPPR